MLLPIYHCNTKGDVENRALTAVDVGPGNPASQEGDSANTFRLPSYGFLNLAAYYTRGRFSAQVNVNDVTDERYATGAYSNLYVQEGDPVNVRTNFGGKF